MRVVIGAAAGNIGHRVAKYVIEAGAEAVLLVRNPAQVASQLASRAAIIGVDLADAGAVVAASRGAEALFWVVPPAVAAPNWAAWYQAVGVAGAAALRENHIPRAVFVSSLGAGAAPGLGTVTYVGDTERQFNETGASVVHLRPGYFMQNFLLQAERIRTQGLIAFPFAEDHDIPFVSAIDIAAAAARYLLRPDWAGQWTHNLMGPANLTLPECAALLSEVWGRPVAYRHQSYSEVQREMAQAGMPLHAQQELLTLYRALGDPHGAYATPRTPDAVTTTSFQEFVRAELLPKLQA